MHTEGKALAMELQAMASEQGSLTGEASNKTTMRVSPIKHGKALDQLRMTSLPATRGNVDGNGGESNNANNSHLEMTMGRPKQDIKNRHNSI